MLKTRQLHIVKETFGGSKDKPWGYYYWEDNEKPHHVYTAFCDKRGHATTVFAKDLDVHVKCEACAELDQDDGGIMIGLSGMVKDVQFDDDEATQFVLNCKQWSNHYSFKDEKVLKVLDNLIAKRDNKMIIEADNKSEDDDFFARLRKEPTVDWNIWHDAFVEAYEQIDFVECAKTLLFYKSLKNGKVINTGDEDLKEDEVFDMVCELQDTMKRNTEQAIIGLMGLEKSEPFVYVDSGNVRVTAWRPEADEEENKACLQFQIYLHETIL